MMPILIRRSNLLVAVTDTRAVEDSWQRQADAITLDLSAGVADGRKNEARGLLGEAVRQAAQGGAEVFVKVNRATTQADIDAAVHQGLTGIMLPGVESAGEITAASGFLAAAEGSQGIAAGSLQIIAMLESAYGVWNIREIISADARVTQAGLDESVLSANMGITPSPEFDPYVYARGRIAIEATALAVQPVGVAHPLGTRPRPLGADEMLKLAADSMNLGFKGVICLHPSWIEPVNTAFTPTQAQVDYYAQVRDVFAQAIAAGTAAVPFAGRMIDVPVDEWAKVVLAMSAACDARNRVKEEAVSKAVSN